MSNKQRKEIQSGAEFSECGKYRFALWRIWDETKPKIMFVGLNPSTANATDDDPTIRRVKSFAKNWGYGGVYMLNCFPYISTNPDDLKVQHDTRKYDNWLQTFGGISKEVVFAWGSFDVVKEMGRDVDLIKMFPKAKALVINKNGSPRHPLYVPASILLIPYINKKMSEKAEFMCLSLGCKNTIERHPINFDTGFCDNCQKELNEINLKNLLP